MKIIDKQAVENILMVMFDGFDSAEEIAINEAEVKRSFKRIIEQICSDELAKKFIHAKIEQHVVEFSDEFIELIDVSHESKTTDELLVEYMEELKKNFDKIIE